MTGRCPPADSRPSAARPTWAEVDLAAIVDNYLTLCSLLEAGPPPAERGARTAHPRIIPVIKADAYGHGAGAVARALAAAGAGMFAVALVEEGADLRQSGISQEILVFGGAWPGQEEELLRHNLTGTVHSADGVRRLEQAARRAARPVRAHIEVDTGMTRMGVRWDALDDLCQALGDSIGVRISGSYSHLACGEEDDPAFTVEQMRRFETALSQLRHSGVDPGETHIANSAGLLYHSSLRGLSARPGIALYGYPPAPRRCPCYFKPALSLKTQVVRICVIAAGESVGYNRRFVAQRPARVATLPIGYADGYRRHLTGAGRVIISDRWAPVLGLVSMDAMCIDVTDIPEAGEGDEVILLGSTPRCRMDAVDWAGILGTIPYDVLCGISSRVPRVYLNRAEDPT